MPSAHHSRPPTPPWPSIPSGGGVGGPADLPCCPRTATHRLQATSAVASPPLHRFTTASPPDPCGRHSAPPCEGGKNMEEMGGSRRDGGGSRLRADGKEMRVDSSCPGYGGQLAVTVNAESVVASSISQQSYSYCYLGSSSFSSVAASPMPPTQERPTTEILQTTSARLSSYLTSSLAVATTPSTSSPPTSTPTTTPNSTTTSDNSPPPESFAPYPSRTTQQPASNFPPPPTTTFSRCLPVTLNYAFYRGYNQSGDSTHPQQHSSAQKDAHGNPMYVFYQKHDEEGRSRRGGDTGAGGETDRGRYVMEVCRKREGGEVGRMFDNVGNGGGRSEGELCVNMFDGYDSNHKSNHSRGYSCRTYGTTSNGTSVRNVTTRCGRSDNVVMDSMDNSSRSHGSLNHHLLSACSAAASFHLPGATSVLQSSLFSVAQDTSTRSSQHDHLNGFHPHHAPPPPHNPIYQRPSRSPQGEETEGGCRMSSDAGKVFKDRQSVLRHGDGRGESVVYEQCCSASTVASLSAATPSDLAVTSLYSSPAVSSADSAAGEAYNYLKHRVYEQVSKKHHVTVICYNFALFGRRCIQRLVTEKDISDNSTIKCSEFEFAKISAGLAVFLARYLIHEDDIIAVLCTTLAYLQSLDTPSLQPLLRQMIMWFDSCNVIFFLAFLAHVFVLDDTIPLKCWGQRLSEGVAKGSNVNKCVRNLLKLRKYRLDVELETYQERYSALLCQRIVG
eukprot:GHVQ01002247.1.p1 GENE.GHVQ01002247.1~~GHVQ01002247.1.p1  ORF type:complete len:838 (+),score=159.02 GHVQ01002247.1:331-2514(+)